MTPKSKASDGNGRLVFNQPFDVPFTIGEAEVVIRYQSRNQFTVTAVAPRHVSIVRHGYRKNTDALEDRKKNSG